MTLSLQSAGRKLVFGILVLVPCCLFIRAASRPWLADRLAGRPTLDSLHRALELEPANAERYFMLARYLELVEHDFTQAERNYRTATEINPHRGRYWLELAKSLHYLGDLNGEGLALRNGLRFEPSNPSLAWTAANFFLVRGERDDAVRELRIALENDSKLALIAYDRLWQYTHDSSFLIDRALLDRSEYYPALMHVLIAHDQRNAAAELWGRWMKHSPDMPAASAFPYIQYLCDQGAYETASSVWNDLAQHSREIRARQAHGNLITNGGFEAPILNGGFEWRYQPNPLASLNLDTVRFHSGNSSLRIEFTGEPGGDAGIAQWLILPANASFQFRGMMRAEEVSTVHGPRFAITDVPTGETLFASEEAVGTTAWIERQGKIAASARPRLVAIRVTRVPEGHIEGRVWIDDLSMTTEPRR